MQEVFEDERSTILHGYSLSLMQSSCHPGSFYECCFFVESIATDAKLVSLGLSLFFDVR